MKFCLGGEIRMPKKYRVPIEDLKPFGIEAKKGVGIVLTKKDGEVVEATITDVRKDSVLVTTK